MTSSRKSPCSPASCSVVIPAYNAERWLGRTLDSVLAQTYPLRQIVVVDDGSTDRTPQVLAEYEDQILMIRQSNEGVAAARNAGSALTDSTHLAFLDADDIWEADKVRKQMSCFDSDPKLVMVQCGLIEIDGNGEELSGQVMVGRSGDLYRDLFLQESAVYGGGSGVVFDREVFDAVGGFDTRLSTSADWQLWLRVARRGPVGLVEEPLLKYRIHANNMHANIDAERDDMLLSLREAIANDPSLASFANRALARCHLTIAGGYWQETRYVRALTHMAIASFQRPASLGYLLRKLR